MWPYVTSIGLGEVRLALVFLSCVFWSEIAALLRSIVYGARRRRDSSCDHSMLIIPRISPIRNGCRAGHAAGGKK